MIFLGDTDYYGKPAKAYRKINPDGSYEFFLILTNGTTIKPLAGTY